MRVVIANARAKINAMAMDAVGQMLMGNQSVSSAMQAMAGFIAKNGARTVAVVKASVW